MRIGYWMAMLMLMLTGIAKVTGGEIFDARLLNPGLPYGNPVAMLHDGEVCQVEVCAAGSSAWGAPLKGERKVTVRYESQQILAGRMDYGQMGNQTAVSHNLKLAKVFAGEQSIVLKSMPNGTLAGTFVIEPKPFRYGLFALTVQVLDANGQELAKKNLEYSAVMSLPLEKPGNIAGFDAYNWSYCWGDPNSAFPKPSIAEKRVLAEHGFSWAHFLGHWDIVHTAPGQINRLEILDLWVDAAKQQNANIVFMLADGAHAYTGKPPTGIPELSNTAAHWDMNLYRKWAETIISRYKDKITVWDVWNEPDSKEFAQAEDRDLQALKIVHELKEKYCPQTKVILSPHTHNGLNYLKRLLNKGAAKYLDGIGVHPYRGLAPEMPEPDAYTGNTSGLATFLDEMVETHKLLMDYHVEPADIYITEKNYNLNYLNQYNELDQANFMIRMQIMARTLDYIKMFINHAPRNGRLLLSAYPNMVTHLTDVSFKNKLAIDDPEVYGFVFEKRDQRVVIPLWSVKGEKVVEVSGLQGEPVVTDMYGNSIPVSYDREDGRVKFLHLSPSPVYLLAPKGSQPKVAITHPVEITAPGKVEKGTNFKLTVNVHELADKTATLAVQTMPGWQTMPVSDTRINATGKYDITVTVPATAGTGDYPVIVSLTAADRRTLAIESTDVSVVLPVSGYRQKYGFLIASDFSGEGLSGWTMQKSQTVIELAKDNGESVVRLTQKGIDHPGVLEQHTPAIPYGMLSFDIKRSNQQQFFTVQLGKLKLTFDKDQRLGYNERTGTFAPITGSVTGTWQTVRVMFDAPDGWFRLWLDEKFCGQFPLPEKCDGLADLRFMTGTLLTSEPATFLLKNIRLTKIETVTMEKDKPVLRWSLCGPFPNRIDPGTMKRPFELDTDYLQSLGGEANLSAAPGNGVKDQGGKLLLFSPFEAPNAAFQGIPMVDFFKVKDLGLHQDQGDILCYGMAYLVSPAEREVTISLSSDDGYTLWVNHKLIGKFNSWPYGHSVGQSIQKYTVKLRQGLNVFLIKVDQGSGGYGFYCEVK